MAHLAFWILWVLGLGLGIWTLRWRSLLIGIHLGIYALFLPLWFPPSRTLAPTPALYVDVSSSMDTPKKKAWREQAVQAFRQRFPKAPVYAFAEKIVPFSQRNKLQKSPTRPPHTTLPGLIITDGYWETPPSLSAPLYPWIPPDASPGALALHAPLEAPPGPLWVQTISPQAGTLTVGTQQVPVSPGTSRVHVSLDPGFHRLVLRISGDSLVHPVWVPPQQTRIGIYTARPDPDAGALRRALSDLGYNVVVVWKDRTFTSSGVQSSWPHQVTGWFALDPFPPGVAANVWVVQMDRALDGVRWHPHPLYPGVLLAQAPSVRFDSLYRIERGEGTYGWGIGNVYRWALRNPEGFRDTLHAFIQDLLNCHPSFGLFPILSRASVGDTLLFWLWVRPSNVTLRSPPSLQTRKRSPGIWEIRIPVRQEGPIQETLYVQTLDRSLPVVIQGKGIPFQEEKPRPGYRLDVLQTLAYATGADVRVGIDALGDLDLPPLTHPYPTALFLFPLVIGLIVLWWLRYREGRP